MTTEEVFKTRLRDEDLGGAASLAVTVSAANMSVFALEGFDVIRVEDVARLARYLGLDDRPVELDGDFVLSVFNRKNCAEIINRATGPV